MFTVIATYTGVGTEYTLEISNDGTTFRVSVSSGPGSRVLREQCVNVPIRDERFSEKAIALQREMALFMVDEALEEVRAELPRIVDKHTRSNDAPLH